MAEVVQAKQIGLVTTGFNGNLSSADDTVQKAMETLDGRGTRTKALTTTTTNAWFTIATIAVADPETVLIDAHVSARRTNGPNEERAGYIVRALGYRAGGGAVREGNENTPFSRESHAAYDVQIIAIGNGMLIQVKGDTGHDVSWACQYMVTRV